MIERLLASLKTRANTRGLVLMSEEDLSREVAAGREALRVELDKLERAGLIELLAPPPFIVIKLRKWPGGRSDPAKTAPKTGAARDRAYSFQSSLSQSKLLNESYRQSEDGEELLKEILETLGETNPVTFRGAIRNYPPGVIRTALGRIRRMKNIHKNRTAVFRFLLPRIGEDLDSNN